MKKFKNLLLIALFILGLGFGAVANATTYYIYNPQFYGATVSGSLAPYFTGDVFVPASGGSDCTYTSLYRFHLGYYPEHNQPSLDYVGAFGDFYENFQGRCGQQVAMHTELAGQGAGNYILSNPPGCPQYNNWTPSYCIFYWDGTTAHMNDCFITPTTPTLTISAPASGSTITSNSTIFSGNYYALSQGTYGWGYLHIWLYNPNTQEHSQTKTFQITGQSGSFSFPISEFGITENGNWQLKANQEWDANTFVDLTPEPAITFNFDVAGNSIPYTFVDWDTWYPENAAGGYTAPSDFADSIEGFFEPIFTNAYQFANRTLAYFNADTSYDKGHEIGLVFPTTQAYLNKINVFFGGFPLIQFFEFLIIVMLGIFIIRTIFKFIPFFG